MKGRVLHITPTYYPAIGGVEAVVRNLSRHLPAFGFSADIAQIATQNSYSEEHEGESTIFRVPLVGHRLIGLASALAAIIPRYDILHVHDPQLMSISLNCLLFKAGKPAVLSTHGGFGHTKNLSIAKAIHSKVLTRSVLSSYNRVLASSYADGNAFSRYAERLTVIENGVDVSRFSQAFSGLPRNPNRWIYWGRLAANKRLDLVIRCVHGLREAGFPVELLIAGQDFDDLRQELSRLVQVLELNSAVTLSAALPESVLLDEIRSRGIFISASEHEGFGISIVEAMAGGLVVVCRNKPPMSQLVDNGRTGILVQFDSASRMVAAISELLRSAPSEFLEMGSRANRSTQRFAWEQVTGKFADVYRQVLSEAGTGESPAEISL